MLDFVDGKMIRPCRRPKGVMIACAVALACLLASLPSRASPLVLTNGVERIDLGGHWDVLRDETGSLTIDDMARPEVAAGFKPLAGNLLAGFDRSAFWLRFTVSRDPASRRLWLLEVDMPYLDHVALFSPDNQGGYTTILTGDHTPFSTRPVPYRDFVFRLDITPQPRTHYLRVETVGNAAVDARLWSSDGFAVAATTDSLLLGIVNGATIIITLMALFQYTLSKDRLYLYFCAYALLSQLMHMSISGYVSQFIFRDSPLLSDAFSEFISCTCLSLGAIFSARAVDVKHSFPRLYKIYLGTAVAAALATADAALPTNISITIPLLACAELISIVTTFIAATMYYDGVNASKYYAAAFFVSAISISIVILDVLGIKTAIPPSSLMPQALAVPHVLLLALGLFQRSAGIGATRLETVRRNERELERRVAQRTAELAETNTALAAEVVVRRTAEDRLRASEGQVRAILDAAPFPMMVASYPEGRFMFINQPASELLNIAPEMAGDHLTKDYYADPEERRHFLWKLRETGCVLGAELQIRRNPDETRWVLLSAVRFTYFNQDAVLVCMNDISTRKRLEESLRLASLRSEAALEAGNQSMREQRNFLSMVSHEFRVPLAIIEASSQLMGIYGRGNADAEDEVAKIGRAVRRMADLIDVCLADDRLDSTTMSLRIAEFDLARVLTEMCDDKRRFAGNRPLSISVGNPATLEADATLLRVAFSNLVDNALKFSPPNTPVDIRVAGDSEGIMVSVSDKGPGISLEDQPRVFEKFFRSTKADRIRGAGLGLFIVRRVIDLHGGSIAIDSLPGRGATFVVWLPVKPPNLNATNTTP
ncbi:histidine kinase [Paramagnetospirillum kuznetsovii]|uniref:histidine kinase n=1 Tax=Paramagnetospirillum kuznetsovii TaxID=2053833 RepID=A0A364NU45_9PROT|nr:sensor histidine kinase [Paramagnetospirillum kuznetsovii]RAU20608.1 histidine kinase [Paramagnetospirillum kuznetsovii]